MDGNYLFENEDPVRPFKAAHGIALLVGAVFTLGVVVGVLL